jgi:hypothetical protein
VAEEELEDYDGLGMLFSGRDSQEDGGLGWMPLSR